MTLFRQTKASVIWIGLLLAVTIFLLEDCDSGGSDGDNSETKCSLPSLMENWGSTSYQFTSQKNADPLLVISDGQSVIVGGIYYDAQGTPYPMALTGPVVDDRNGELTGGAIDWNWNGSIDVDEDISAVMGKLNISATTMRAYEVIIDGNSIADMVGNCVQSESTEPQLSSIVAEVAALYEGSGDEDPGPFSCSGPGWETDSDKAVYYFRDPIRIGDDENFNDYHDPDFKISSPTGLSYSASFNVPSGCHFSDARIQYTIAGAKEAAKVYLNGSLVGRTCNPGNTAYAVKRCDDINVTGKLRTGSNTLKVSTVLDPSDKGADPYDDIEIYNMRITLTR